MSDNNRIFILYAGQDEESAQIKNLIILDLTSKGINYADYANLATTPEGRMEELKSNISTSKIILILSKRYIYHKGSVDFCQEEIEIINRTFFGRGGGQEALSKNVSVLTTPEFSKNFPDLFCVVDKNKLIQKINENATNCLSDCKDNNDTIATITNRKQASTEFIEFLLGERQNQLLYQNDILALLDNISDSKKIIDTNKEVKHETFIEEVYSKLNKDIFKGGKLSRFIEGKNLTGGDLETNFLNFEERKIYDELKEINECGFNPHRNFEGSKYYVNTKMDTAFEQFFESIKNKASDLWFYTGDRGSGKTFFQNIWLNKNFKELECEKIFHVRCDVHKIYILMGKNTSLGDNNLTIADYLDLQFLYILLQYKDKKNRTGKKSDLMEEIYNILDMENIEIVRDIKKYKNMGEFLEENADNIYYSEVTTKRKTCQDGKLYPYSYAIILMQSILNSQPKTSVEEVLTNFDRGMHKEKLEIFLSDITSLHNRDLAEELVKEALQTNDKGSLAKALYDIERDTKKDMKNTTTNWLRISKHIQKFILTKGYKILKMVDGIDNIVIQDSEDDKRFYNDKIKELSEIKKSQGQENIYYFIALRNDTFNDIRVLDNNTSKYIGGNQGNTQDVFSLSRIIHQSVQDKLDKVVKKRYEYLVENIPNMEVTTEYKQVLKCLFLNSNQLKVEKIHNIREILRNFAFVSLHAMFKVKEYGFQEPLCVADLNSKFDEVMFLRNQSYINTPDSIRSAKPLPNIFYFGDKQKQNWLGLCRVRILQLLRDSNLSEREIIDKLTNLYPDNHIKNKIESLRKYDMIRTSLCNDTRDVKFTVAEKGEYLLNTISCNINVLYYMCLDSLIPESIVSVQYMNLFQRNISDEYGLASVIKTVLTFIFFIQYVHNEEMKIIQNNDSRLKSVLIMPLELQKIEKNMKDIYCNKISDYAILDRYFSMLIGNNDESLIEFEWIKKIKKKSSMYISY